MRGMMHVCSAADTACLRQLLAEHPLLTTRALEAALRTDFIERYEMLCRLQCSPSCHSKLEGGPLNQGLICISVLGDSQCGAQYRLFNCLPWRGYHWLAIDQLTVV